MAIVLDTEQGLLLGDDELFALDGKPVPILRTYGVFRAVGVPPGQHRVTFSYQPRNFWIGTAVAGFAAALLVLWGRGWRMVEKMRPRVLR